MVGSCFYIFEPKWRGGEAVSVEGGAKQWLGAWQEKLNERAALEARMMECSPRKCLQKISSKSCSLHIRNQYCHWSRDIRNRRKDFHIEKKYLQYRRAQTSEQSTSPSELSHCKELTTAISQPLKKTGIAWPCLPVNTGKATQRRPFPGCFYIWIHEEGIKAGSFPGQ